MTGEEASKAVAIIPRTKYKENKKNWVKKDYEYQIVHNFKP